MSRKKVVPGKPGPYRERLSRGDAAWKRAPIASKLDEVWESIRSLWAVVEVLAPAEVLDLAGCAAFLGVSPHTIVRRCRAGLPCFRTAANKAPTFLRRDVTRWMSEHSTPGGRRSRAGTSRLASRRGGGQ